MLRLVSLASLFILPCTGIQLSSYSSETSALNDIKSILGGANECSAALPPTLAADAVKRGWFLLAETVAVACSSAGDDKMVGSLSEAAGSIRSSLQRIMQLATSTKALAPLEPAFQWAQSPTHLYINVKFAHKLDAPACLDLIDPTYAIGADKVQVRAACKDSDKRFALDLDLFGLVNSSTSSWQLTSVGRGSFTLQKTLKSRWARLIKSLTRPKNMHIWWEMQEQYEAELEDLPEDAQSPPPPPPPKAPAATPDSLQAKVDADKARIRNLAESRKRDIEQGLAKKKAEIAKEAELKTSEAEHKAAAATQAVTYALAQDIDTVDKLKVMYEKIPEAYIPAPARALDALEGGGGQLAKQDL